MCGKFTQLATWAEVVAFSMPLGTDAESRDIVTSTPMRMARIIRLDDKGERENVPMRWGFADLKAKSPSRPKHMHARSETIDTLPTFAHAFAHHRGVLIVDTFNEGEEMPNGKTRQWTLTPKDRQSIAMAVICEQWIHDAETLWTFVQVTTPANALIAQITDRMPAILRPEECAIWLGETGASLDRIKALLQVYDDGGAWDMQPQAAPPKPAKPPKAAPQSDLF